MTADYLSQLAGIVLSLVFSYAPGLSDKFKALDPTKKRLIMLGMLALTAGAVYGLSCAKIYSAVTCDQAGALKLVSLFIQAAITNQAAFALTPKTGVGADKQAPVQ